MGEGNAGRVGKGGGRWWRLQDFSILSPWGIKVIKSDLKDFNTQMYLTLSALRYLDNSRFNLTQEFIDMLACVHCVTVRRNERVIPSMCRTYASRCPGKKKKKKNNARFRFAYTSQRDVDIHLKLARSMSFNDSEIGTKLGGCYRANTFSLDFISFN